MSLIAQLLKDRPKVAQRGEENDPVPSGVRVSYQEDDTIIFSYDGWEFDWQEKVVGEQDGLLETELITDLTDVQDGDAGEPGSRMFVVVKWGPEVDAWWVEQGQNLPE